MIENMKVFEKQFWHLLGLVLLILGIIFLLGKDSSMVSGSLWSIQTKIWVAISVTVPVLHQVYVLLCWRFELYHQSLSKIFGANAFKVYKVGFFILFASRMVFIIFLSISNTKTLTFSSIFKYVIVAILSIIVIYAFYSVIRFFGVDRAAGLDHFDSSISKLDFVKKGIFKYTNNGMYKYAFLVFYIPGIIWESKASILIAVYSHIYIWVHYYFTELPDIKTIYSAKNL